MAKEQTTISAKVPLATRRLVELAASEAGQTLSRFIGDAACDLAVKQLTEEPKNDA